MLPLADILFVRAKRVKMIQKMGLALVNNVFTTPNVLLILMFALVGGLLGALLGKKMLKKYFTKAGIL
jgi:energy-coupling factor transport system substrate-specific component